MNTPLHFYKRMKILDLMKAKAMQSKVSFTPFEVDMFLSKNKYTMFPFVSFTEEEKTDESRSFTQFLFSSPCLFLAIFSRILLRCSNFYFLQYFWGTLMLVSGNIDQDIFRNAECLFLETFSSIFLRNAECLFLAIFSRKFLRNTDASARIGKKLSIISPPPFFCLLGEWVIVNGIMGWVKRIRG